VLKQDPRHFHARQFLFDALRGRASVLVALARREEAARDWRQMLEISEGQPQVTLRLYRPFALVFLGEHDRAAAEIKALLAEGQNQGGNLLLFARVHSLCNAAAAADPRLAPVERQKRADKYGGRAVELLRQAQAAGFFQGPGQITQLKESEDLKTIRSRPDFQ